MQASMSELIRDNLLRKVKILPVIAIPITIRRISHFRKMKDERFFKRPINIILRSTVADFLCKNRITSAQGHPIKVTRSVKS